MSPEIQAFAIAGMFQKIFRKKRRDKAGDAPLETCPLYEVWKAIANVRKKEGGK